MKPAGIRTTDHDVLRTSSTPVNRVAGRIRGGGITFEPKVSWPPGLRHWKEPPNDLIVPMPKAGHKRTFIDLTGRRFGRFTVIAYLGKPNPKVKARWLVRCQCGDYEWRSANAITSPDADPDACCQECNYIKHLKKGRRDA